MKMRGLLVAGFFSIALSGCASFRGGGAEWPWPTDKAICVTGTCTDSEALQSYLQAHVFCRSVHNYYESGGNKASTTQLVIGGIGSLAGAVISPLSSGDAAKAWSGLSGATNALQATVKENFAGSISAKRTNAVLDATTRGEASYTAADNSTAKVMASINMATACSMAPAKADTDAIKALAQ